MLERLIQIFGSQRNGFREYPVVSGIYVLCDLIYVESRVRDSNGNDRIYDVVSIPFEEPPELAGQTVIRTVSTSVEPRAVDVIPDGFGWECCLRKMGFSSWDQIYKTAEYIMIFGEIRERMEFSLTRKDSGNFVGIKGLDPIICEWDAKEVGKSLFEALFETRKKRC